MSLWGHLTSLTFKAKTILSLLHKKERIFKNKNSLNTIHCSMYTEFSSSEAGIKYTFDRLRAKEF